MNILAVDTSSKAASVALYKDGCQVGECLYNHGKTHSVYIAPMIEDMLKACETDINDIDYFACGIGPWSFTGVRIGVTMTKTFGMVTGKPCVGVDSLFAAAKFWEKNEFLTVAIEDARRERVFACGVLDGKAVIETGVFTLDELFKAVEPYDNVLFVGGGTRVYGKELLERGYDVDFSKLISGSAIATLAMREVVDGNAVSCYELMPKYLLKSQAEREKNEAD